MPRLRNRATGVVVNVSDETASRLGSDYEPVEDQKTTKTASKRTPSAKK